MEIYRRVLLPEQKPCVLWQPASASFARPGFNSVVPPGTLHISPQKDADEIQRPPSKEWR